MILALYEETDVPAAWAVGCLQARGLPVEPVTGLDLASAVRWEHRISRSDVIFKLELADGRRISGKDCAATLNRLTYLPSAWVQQVGGADRDYALQEMYAFFLSWIHSLPKPLLNPPVPQGLCGNWRHPSSWADLASRAGFPIKPYQQSDEDDPDALWRSAPDTEAATAFVAGSHAILPPGLPSEFRAACFRLASASEVSLLGIDFTFSDHEGWQFRHASVMPDLIRGGEPLLDAMVEVLAS